MPQLGVEVGSRLQCRGFTPLSERPRELVWRVSELCYRRAPVRAFSIHGNDALLGGNSLDLFAGPAMEVGRLRAALARREPDA